MTNEPEGPRPGEGEDTGDDAVIGIAFRRSVVAIVAVAAIGLSGYWLARRSRGAAPQKAISVGGPEAVKTQGSAPTLSFTDVAAASGIGFVHSNGAYGDKLLPETMGGGVAVFDVDGDGDSDLLFVNSGSWPHHRDGKSAAAPLALYRNDTKPGGPLRFADVTREWGLGAGFPEPLYGMGVAIGDYDGDGDRDVFLTGVGTNRLLRNDGDHFSDVTRAAGVGGMPGQWSTGAGFFD